VEDVQAAVEPMGGKRRTAHVSTQTIWRACTSKLAVNLLVADTPLRQ
jgi:hypothetical protein